MTARSDLLRRHGFASYGAYLSSRQHAVIREFVLTRDKHACCLCGLRAWMVHHVEYTPATMFANPTRATTRGIISVCGTCHEAIHFTDDGTWSGEPGRKLKELKRIFQAADAENKPTTKKKRKPKPKNKKKKVTTRTKTFDPTPRIRRQSRSA